MRRGSLDRRTEILLRREVRDGVVDEDDVELSAEPQRPHVAFEVLALGVERAAEREHLGRDVGQRAVEARLQVRRVVPAARSELEQRPGVADRDVVHHAADERRLVPIVGRVREEVEPRREVRVHVQRGQTRSLTPMWFSRHALERT